ncbi:MAG: sulfotransferase [Streptosporangiales bacterium]|nr:sulfotransferase [Streptosporangiales bacterium]MBO0891603.1 sulfotransferase [Acidothermales bacterium]
MTHGDAPARDRPIFVFGCPRSGTTMLQLMLHGHPRIAIPPETRFVERCYFDRRAFGDLRDPDNRRRLAASIVTPEETRFRDLQLDPADVVEQVVAAGPTVGSACATVLRMYAARFGKPRWGDKRPGYHRVIPILRTLFPDAVFVHLVRDGRDCVASLERASWWNRPIHHSIHAWMSATSNARRAARTLPADSFYELRYEELVAEPGKQLSALCEFLDEEYDEAMATPKALAGVVVAPRKMRVEGTYRDVSTSSIGNWRTRLEPWQVDLCEAIMGDRLREYGYDLTGAGRAPAAHRLAYARAAFGRSRRWYGTVLADRVERTLRPQPLAAEPQ